MQKIKYMLLYAIFLNFRIVTTQTQYDMPSQTMPKLWLSSKLTATVDKSPLEQV